MPFNKVLQILWGHFIYVVILDDDYKVRLHLEIPLHVASVYLSFLNFFSNFLVIHLFWPRLLSFNFFDGPWSKLKIWWFPAFVVNRALFFITLQILLSSIRLLLLLLNFSLSFPTPFLHPFLSLPFNKFSNFQL